MYTFPNSFTLLGGLLLLLPALSHCHAINATSTEYVPNFLGTQNGPACPTNNTLMTPECPCLTAYSNTTTTTITKRDNPEYMHNYEQYTSSSGWRVQVQQHSLYVAPHAWTFASYSNKELLMNSIKHEALWMTTSPQTTSPYCASLAGTQDWRLYFYQNNGWRLRDLPDDLSTRLFRSAMAGWNLYNYVEFSVITAPGSNSEYMFSVKIGPKGHIQGC